MTVELPFLVLILIIGSKWSEIKVTNALIWQLWDIYVIWMLELSRWCELRLSESIILEQIDAQILCLPHLALNLYTLLLIQNTLSKVSKIRIERIWQRIGCFDVSIYLHEVLWDGWYRKLILTQALSALTSYNYCEISILVGVLETVDRLNNPGFKLNLVDDGHRPCATCWCYFNRVSSDHYTWGYWHRIVWCVLIMDFLCTVAGLVWESERLVSKDLRWSIFLKNEVRDHRSSHWIVIGTTH